MIQAGWAIFHKEPNTAYALGSCTEYALIKLDWDAQELLREAHEHWCVGGWESVLDRRPVCRGWGKLAAGNPTFKHLGYTLLDAGRALRLERDPQVGGFREMRRLAFVVPLHRPKFRFGQTLISTFLQREFQHQADLYLIFSSEDEIQVYLNETGKDALDHIFPITYLPASFRSKSCREMHDNCIAIAKTYYALALLSAKYLNTSGVKRRQYDYLVAMDVESEFFGSSTLDLYGLVNGKVLERRITALSCDGKFASSNMRLSSEAVLQDDDIALQVVSDSTHNFTLYTWWNELPIYEPRHLENMLWAYLQQKKRGSDAELLQLLSSSTFSVRLVAEHFEHLLYQAWLIAKGGWFVEKLQVAAQCHEESWMEQFASYSDDVRAELLKQAKPLWLRGPTSAIRAEGPGTESIFLRFHTDRLVS